MNRFQNGGHYKVRLFQFNIKFRRSCKMAHLPKARSAAFTPQKLGEAQLASINSA
jgi:hypothetical protein